MRRDGFAFKRSWCRSKDRIMADGRRKSPGGWSADWNLRNVVFGAAVAAAGMGPLIANGTTGAATLRETAVKTGDERSAGSAGAHTLSYEGATTIGMNIMPKATELFAAQTGVTFSYIGGAGADAGFKAAVEGRATFGGVARELTVDERACVGGYEVIGYDVMGVFVNAENSMKSLTRAQLKEIFTGRVTNWNQFEGPTRVVTVYSEKLSGGRATVKAFKDMVLGGEKYGPLKELEDATDCIRDVATDAGGITASSMSFAIPGVTALSVDGALPTRDAVQSGAYPLKRPLILVTKDMPAGDMKAFLDFMLTSEAQAIIGKKFVPVK
jgi:phosphate transport system substrate-binding protein